MTPDFAPYEQRLAKHQAKQRQLQNQYNRISLIRVAMVLGMAFLGYLYAGSWESWKIYAIGALLLAFLWLMRYHYQLGLQRDFERTLAQINADELAFLKGEKNPFADGASYAQQGHAYSLDLDIFGPRSLYHHLNRTGTYIGGQTLASWLQSPLDGTTILQQQEAVKELAGRLDWRQQWQASARCASDKEALHHNLVAWSKMPPYTLSLLNRAASFFMPPLVMAGIVAWILMEPYRLPIFNATVLLMLCNMGILSLHFKQIKQELLGADRVHRTIAHYGAMLQLLENEPFQSPRLQALQASLGGSASKALRQLSAHFAAIETIQNSTGAFFMNGIFLYHLHKLHALQQWKKDWAPQVTAWLQAMGETEAMSSLGHLCYNEPSYSFPEMAEGMEVSFEEMGHPLISKRVNNSISLPPFVILTGSNMSGKSTFLRALGVNMVLACAGAPVCAKHARLRPLPVLASMRQSDSLADSESYFFAEVKRLQQMMQSLSQRPSLVLLDEILRGTNSDDKRSGTVGVIEKMLRLGAIGVIATHDLEVCLTTSRFPQQLSNKCFEVEIKDGELHFDYRLREGICQNKSATFLMEKMGVV